MNLYTVLLKAGEYFPGYVAILRVQFTFNSSSRLLFSKSLLTILTPSFLQDAADLTALFASDTYSLYKELLISGQLEVVLAVGRKAHLRVLEGSED